MANLPQRKIQPNKGALPFLLTAGGMALILCAVYAVCGYWPFGPNSVMTGDLEQPVYPLLRPFLRLQPGKAAACSTDTYLFVKKAGAGSRKGHNGL